MSSLPNRKYLKALRRKRELQELYPDEQFVVVSENRIFVTSSRKLLIIKVVEVIK